ncbi:MAG: choice-of-anchor J domain-containing protein [Bacteroidia bacterium]
MSLFVNTNMRFQLLAVLMILMSGWANAQVTSRSGFTAPQESHQAKRPFPCRSSDAIFEETFSGNTLPTGWTALARDTATINPAIDTIYQDNWQQIVDFKDPTNGVVASPSWHDFTDRKVPTDNWLISPEVNLGDNTCFSWVAYSQDRFFSESYDVLISPTGSTDLTSFTDTIEVVQEEGFFLVYRSANLSKYANQAVRVAFRHTKVQGFMLVLDDVRFAEVDAQDVGVSELIRPSGGLRFDSLKVTFAIRNYGSDTVNLENVRLGFRDNNQTIAEDTLVIFNDNKIRLAPNDTAHVSHPVRWNPDSDSAAFDLWAWTKLGNDAFSGNDTLYRRVGVGVDVTSIDEGSSFANLTAFPNPSNGLIYIQGSLETAATLHVFDATGRNLIAPRAIPAGAITEKVDLQHIPAGIYFISLQNAKGDRFTKRMLIH